LGFLIFFTHKIWQYAEYASRILYMPLTMAMQA